MPLRFFIILGLILLAEFYGFVLVRSSLRPINTWWRISLLIGYIVLTLSVWLSIFLFHHINWAGLPHMARNIFIATALGLTIAKLLMMVIMLIDDLQRLIRWIAGSFSKPASFPAGAPTERHGIPRSRFLKTMALLIGGLVLFGFEYGITNRYRYRIKRVKLSFKNLPDAFKGLRIVQISDIHSGSFDSVHSVAHGVDLAMAENADLILFTGDLVNNHAEEIIPYKPVFSKLKAPLGVYSTLGNHDYGDYENDWPSPAAKAANLERLKQHHADMGWRLMMNEHVFLQRGDAQIALIGIENWSAKPQFTKYGDMKKAYAGLEDQPELFKILMSHDPSHWDAQVVTDFKEVDLTLSGHTHGMQCGIEIPGFKWSPVQYMYKKWAGLYRQGRQHLYVNRGYGFLGYPGRLGILPEITVFELS